jgi:F-type H+-transporting ATPase subunit alpha
MVKPFPSPTTDLLTTLNTIQQTILSYQAQLQAEEVGVIRSLGHGVARVSGLLHVQSEELVQFADQSLGMVFNLDAQEVGVILLSSSERLQAGSEVRRTGRVMDAPVGEALLGRVIDATGQPLDGQGPLPLGERRPIEREAPAILDRAPVSDPLQTGLKVIDALIPIGRGQRELILGDRQTGKTAIALDTILNQADQGVICFYCGIGQRSSSVARLLAKLREHHALHYCVVVIASGDDPPGLQYITPYAATTMAEYFMEQGQDVLIIYDDLVQHARAYRELSLLLRRPPGREAFPGDIFYIHSRLLERATHLRPELGGGSLTALPIVETEAQNLSAYIPTNLVSITDGQIYLTPDLFSKGIQPAVDVGRSVSRVGSKAQLPAYRSVAAALRLAYAQFEELEVFSRFGTRLDPTTQQQLGRGQRVREVLKQPQYQPLSPTPQINALLAVTAGILDPLPVESIRTAGDKIAAQVTQEHPDIDQRIRAGEPLLPEDRHRLLESARAVVTSILSVSEHRSG